MDIIGHFEQRAHICEQQGAPFTASLMRAIYRSATNKSVCGDLILNWPSNPEEDALALRACSAFHLLSLKGTCQALSKCFPPNKPTQAELMDGVGKAMHDHDQFIADRLIAAPQTNEINRCAILIAALAKISKATSLPLDVIELGASAGLNLLFDAFSYEFGGGRVGSADPVLAIAPDVCGDQPDLAEIINVRDVSGCDLNPIDVTTDEGAYAIMSYVWPDQSVRLNRLQSALNIARKVQPNVSQESAEAFLKRKLADRREGACLVVFSSIFWQFASAQVRSSIQESLATYGGRASTKNPIVWVQIEGRGKDSALVDSKIKYWPMEETFMLAESDFHANWVRFL